MKVEWKLIQIAQKHFSCLVFSSIAVPLLGADFTNTFRLLSAVSCPVGEQEDSTNSVVELIVEQCASLEELKVANHPTMQPG